MNEIQYICSICKGRIRIGNKQGGATVLTCVRCDKSKELLKETQVVEVTWDKEEK